MTNTFVCTLNFTQQSSTFFLHAGGRTSVLDRFGRFPRSPSMDDWWKWLHVHLWFLRLGVQAEFHQGRGRRVLHTRCDFPPSIFATQVVAAPALTRAMFRDGSSGGFVRTAVITEAGVERQSFHVDLETVNVLT